ncbi:MAG: GGDEF domain-containing protein [Colwellia sp.]|nr:GGDEF domain-containing protein [Colwellia sp.]
MIEGFDVRTLALTNLLIDFILGLGVLTFARSHPTFKGFHHIGYSYLLLALAFLLIGLRDYISHWFSIIAANSLLIIAFSLLARGLFIFFNKTHKGFVTSSFVIQFLLIPSFIYLTFYNFDTRWRIIIISILLVIIFTYIAVTLFRSKNKHHFLYIIQFSFLFCAAFFAYRTLWTIAEVNLDTYMQAGIVHGLSFLTLQLLTVSVSFAISWSASDELAKDLALQATIDPLTQTYNRRALESIAEKSFAKARRVKTNIVIIIMDIDDFKHINDAYGHQAGDQVLVEFTQRLRDNLREYDTLARYGGEEFLLLLPNTELTIAQTIAEKLRNIIAAPVFLIHKNIHVTITASFGLAMGQGELLDWEQLMFQADSALYQAKNEGKNKVHTHFGDVINLNKVKS